MLGATQSKMWQNIKHLLTFDRTGYYYIVRRSKDASICAKSPVKYTEC